MLELIKKDLLINSKTLIRFAAFGGLTALLFSRMEQGVAFIALWSMMIPYMYLPTSCYTEELNKGLAFCRSLPIPASTIVWSKFAGAVLVTLGSGAYVLLLAELSRYLGWLELDPSFPLLAAVTSPWVAVFIMHGVFLLLFFSHGYKRAQSIVSMLPLLFLLPLIFPESAKAKLSSYFATLFGGRADLRSVLALLIALALGIEALLTWRASKVFEAKDVP
ncbi:MAG: ABC-2 transporter permease [Firmicutes bacterium]|nr:ABC-2 transporter permease [Candidatus Fermentithermobacillaceae bacterium]